ncbi:MAG: hypothetical protein Q9218_003176 [Villophora microphyllina]
MEQQQQMMRDKSNMHLLTDALRKFRELAVLAIEAAVFQGLGGHLEASSAREWHPIWIRASQVYRTTTLAIAQSSVAIASLQAYHMSQRCSVPTWDVNELMPDLEAAGFVKAAENIKRISLSVSTRVKSDAQGVANALANLSEVDRAYYEAGMGTQAGLLSKDDPDALSTGNYPGVARLLKVMPNLEDLNLHLYNTLIDGKNSYAKVFSRIVDEADVDNPTTPQRQSTLLFSARDDRPHTQIRNLAFEAEHLSSQYSKTLAAWTHVQSEVIKAQVKVDEAKPEVALQRQDARFGETDGNKARQR